jgi:hypothetical protein
MRRLVNVYIRIGRFYVVKTTKGMGLSAFQKYWTRTADEKLGKGSWKVQYIFNIFAFWGIFIVMPPFRV